MSRKQYVDQDFQSVVKILNMPNPSSAQDVATKNYVDNALLGVGTPIGVKARTTANVTISTALNNADTIDGVTLATGDLVLVDQQTTAAEDGIYVVGVSPARSTMLAAGEDARGLLVVVEAGTANGGKLFMQTANPAIINTDGLAFTAITAGVTYTADGQGLELSGSQFALELDGATLTKSATGVKVTTPVDTSIHARWASNTGPASAGATITQAHSRGHAGVMVQVQVVSTGEVITSGVDITVDTTNIVVTFAASQADRSAFRITWVG